MGAFTGFDFIDGSLNCDGMPAKCLAMREQAFYLMQEHIASREDERAR